jgi:hypothetical protein
MHMYRDTLAVITVLVSLVFCSPLPSLDISNHASTQFIATWRSTQHGGPTVIASEEQLTAAQPFVTPILHGGLGRVLFQIAGAHVLAKRHNVTCVIAWWNQQHATDEYKPFGGRGEPAPGITLKHMFPAIFYVDFEPQARPESMRGGSMLATADTGDHGYATDRAFILRLSSRWMQTVAASKHHIRAARAAIHRC